MMIDYIVGGILAVLLVLTVTYMIKRRRSGGCSGCSGCSGCPAGSDWVEDSCSCCDNGRAEQ